MRAVLILGALALAVTPVEAQIPIRAGQSVTGRLTQTDPKFSDGSHYKLYAFVGNKGETVTVDLSSDDFDSNLLIADAAGNTLKRNDDGGGMCNARVTFVPSATANYRIYANSSAQAELGEYHLMLTAGARPAPVDTTCKGFGSVAGVIEVGQTISGNLTSDDPLLQSDSTYFERWILPVKPNQSFTVDLESNDFDAYLILAKGRGDKLVDNDDGGGNCNARLVYTATDDHPLRIIVNTASRPHRQTGHFTLRVTEGEANVESKGNCRFSNNVAAGTGAQTLQQNVSSSGTSASIQMVGIGETVNGRLTSSDSLYADNTYYKFYQFSPQPGQPVTIDLSSDDFDPVLIIRGDDLSQSIINDDGGPGCSARVSRVFPSRGPYRILVNTTATPERQTGNFSLSITEGSKPVQDPGTADCQAPQGNASTSANSTVAASSEHSIDVGQSRQGSLSSSDVLLNSDSTYAQAWTIQGTAGQTITIDLESDAFDAYLFLRGPGITGGRDFQDDDSGGNCNARLTATFPQTGAYEIVVNAQEHYRTGAFTLSVTNGSKPKSVARCARSNQ